MTHRDASDRIDWLDLGSVPGLKGTTGRLGMAGSARQESLRPEDGVDVLVSLVDAPHIVVGGVRQLRYPIPDLEVPADVATFESLVGSIGAEVLAGRSVLVTCMAGYGRTGMTVACALVRAGLGAEAAIALVRTTRPGAIETDGQLTFVREWPQG